MRGVLGMNVMVIILFTRAQGNISDKEGERFHELILLPLSAVANFKTSMLCLSTQILRSSCMITE